MIPGGMDFLEGLNPQQREAVTHTEGPLLILAGAGSGKTRVITHRVAYLVAARHVPPSAILAVTFTNKAANEMRERVLTLLEDAGCDASPRLSTFHSFCVRLLRSDGEPLARIRRGFDRRFSIYDEDAQLATVKAVYRKLGLDEKEFVACRVALSRISHAKSRKLAPEDLQKKAASREAESVAVVYNEYEAALRGANALDFDDLLLEAVRLLEHDQPTREAWNRRLSYIMIDEYQDTNRSQYELMRLLSEGHRNVCVVGDEDQSIYSWRGADIRNILDFERDFPNARTIRLEHNYRSTKNILSAAGAVVANNRERKGKKLWTDAAAGERITVYAGHDAENEALYIADAIERLLVAEPSATVAVLYRTNFQSRQIEEALRRYDRKYTIVGGFSFYQRAEIRDTLAYLKLALSNRDSAALLRIVNTPARGIGRTTVEQVEQYAAAEGLSLWDALGSVIDEGHLSTRSQSALAAFRALVQEIGLVASQRSLPDTLRFILERTGYRRMLEEDKSPEAEARLENLGELLNAAAEAAARGEAMAEFLDHAALVSDADGVDEAAQVNLLTLHNAKGLEFPVVFISGLEMGLFPHSRSMDSPEALEEERRLCYVGMTRARQRLYLTWAKYRRRFGSREQERSTPSWFLNEVPEELVVRLGDPATAAGELDLAGERHEVRQAARRSTFTGTTHNSLDNISQFFAERGMVFRPGQAGPAVPPPPAAPKSVLPSPAPPPKKGMRPGMTVEHPKYGSGTIVRREGEGENAKITVSFPHHGLKKLIAKYAGLKREG
jgi:DNA helicase-2/ATP-dependent DNA helicase PcrA